MLGFLVTLAVLAAWWTVVWIWSHRSRSEVEAISLSPVEAEQVRQLRENTESEWPGFVTALNQIIQGARKQPGLLLKIPLILMVYLGAIFLTWPVFWVFRHHHRFFRW